MIILFNSKLITALKVAIADKLSGVLAFIMGDGSFRNLWGHPYWSLPTIYEHVFIWIFDSIKELKEILKKYFEYYNNRREHQSLNYKTPAEVYRGSFNEQIA
ncbi:MAG: hypothetical protein COX48_04925 [bacterium (Candidatus Stahlbacteria) CG23_combo_of_CG06-09_8_20_14_all_34_7]|nr:MAG: hypothetical protein COX48_04925 [bacterium (Candidatus Stahlbacteria) CG23_combo_of_CG06-09_8_20_14_all_34_7]